MGLQYFPYEPWRKGSGLHKPIINQQSQPTDFRLDVPNMKDTTCKKSLKFYESYTYNECYFLPSRTFYNTSAIKLEDTEHWQKIKKL